MNCENQKFMVDTAKRLIQNGLSAWEIKERLVALYGREIVDRFWGLPRDNINQFVKECLAGPGIQPPFLEIGCGGRSFKPEAETRFGKDVVYLALDHFYPEDGKQTSRLPNLIGDALALPIRSGSVNTVICAEVLEHLPDDCFALEEIWRVLDFCGQLVLTVPGMDIPRHEKLPYQLDFRRYTMDSLKGLLKEGGFDEIIMEEKRFGDLQINILLKCKKK